MIALKDILPYNLEQLHRDDLHNIIMCVVNEHHTVQTSTAPCCVSKTPFLELRKGSMPMGRAVELTGKGVLRWLRSVRAFLAFEIKENRRMLLLPKKITTEIGPVHIDSSLCHQTLRGLGTRTSH